MNDPSFKSEQNIAIVLDHKILAIGNLIYNKDKNRLQLTLPINLDGAIITYIMLKTGELPFGGRIADANKN